MTSLLVTSTTVACLSKKCHMYWCILALFLLDHYQVHAGTRAPHGTREVAGELSLQLVLFVDRVLVERLGPSEWGLV
jgi:hypothetical protein